MSDRAERTRVREPVAGGGSARPVRRPGLASWGWWVAAGAVTAALLTVRSRPDVDLWLHLRIGGLLRDGARFEGLPDPLAVLPDRTYVPTQWLAQVSMSGLYDAGGMAAIQLLRVILVVDAGRSRRARLPHRRRSHRHCGDDDRDGLRHLRGLG